MSEHLMQQLSTARVNCWIKKQNIFLEFSASIRIQLHFWLLACPHLSARNGPVVPICWQASMKTCWQALMKTCWQASKTYPLTGFDEDLAVDRLRQRPVDRPWWRPNCWQASMMTYLLTGLHWRSTCWQASMKTYLLTGLDDDLPVDRLQWWPAWW